jgi:hypothetical protein
MKAAKATTITAVVTEKVKEKWMKPELAVLSVKDKTVGGSGSGGDSSHRRS